MSKIVGMESWITIKQVHLNKTKCLITWHLNIQCDILIVHQKDIRLCSSFWIGFHVMLQKLLVQTYHFLSNKEKDASHIFMTHVLLCSPSAHRIYSWYSESGIHLHSYTLISFYTFYCFQPFYFNSSLFGTKKCVPCFISWTYADRLHTFSWRYLFLAKQKRVAGKLDLRILATRLL